MIPALVLGTLMAAADSPPATDLSPTKTDGGIVFKFSSATPVYIAGDFNGWAHNAKGKVSDGKYKLTGPDAQGLCQITVPLKPGEHKMKFVVSGTQWVTPSWAKDTDHAGNALVFVNADGMPLLQNPSGQSLDPKHGENSETFSVYAPTAKSVYLVGDFNNWGNTQNNQVTDPKFLMQSAGGGAWTLQVPITPGKHDYKFVIDGNTWVTDPNATGVDDQGNSFIDVK